MEKSIKRIAKDIHEITKNNLEKEGIFFIHSEKNIFEGITLIMGPENTPYEFGIYCFKIIFPNNYPINPPKVIFLSNDSFNTRYNPNFYRDGKVCISLLNTWKGESWTSCCTLKSILLVLQSVMNSQPLLNEPGVQLEKNFNDIKIYSDIISYRNLSFNLINFIKILEPNTFSIEIPGEIIQKIKFYIKNNKKNILSKINFLLKEFENEYKVKFTSSNHININTSFYKMSCSLNYLILKKDFNNFIKNI